MEVPAITFYKRVVASGMVWSLCLQGILPSLILGITHVLRTMRVQLTGSKDTMQVIPGGGQKQTDCYHQFARLFYCRGSYL